MLEAKRTNVLLADEQQFARLLGRGGGGIIPVVKYRKLSNRTAGTLDGQDLLAAGTGYLENSHGARFNHVKAFARFALGKNYFAPFVTARQGC